MNSFTKNQKVDPSVECLIKLFPEDFIRSKLFEDNSWVEKKV
jgi:hypothetical protein